MPSDRYMDLLKQGFMKQGRGAPRKRKLAQKKLRFHRVRCPHSPVEFQNYAWDKKKSENGAEQVIKKRDHCPDAGRYIVNDVFAQEWRLSA
jgi:hypothetical protein